MRRFLNLDKEGMKVSYIVFNFVISIVAIYVYLPIVYGVVLGYGTYHEYRHFFESLIEGYFLKVSIPILIFNFILAIVINKSFKYFF